MTITIGVAAVGPPTWPFVESLYRLEPPAGETMRLLRAGPLAVDVARNELVKAFLATSDSALLLVDADAVLHPTTLQRLWSWDKQIVAALAFQRHGPCPPTVMRGWLEDQITWRNGMPFPRGIRTEMDEVRQWLRDHPGLLSSGPVVLEPRPDDALIPIDASGCHCLLIRREVLKGMAPPWFVGGPELAHQGEDFFFFWRAAQFGFNGFVDLSCMAGHCYGERSLAALDWLVWDRVSRYGEDE